MRHDAMNGIGGNDLANVTQIFKAVFALEKDEWMWRAESCQAIEVKFQLGAIRQANQSSSAPQEKSSGMLPAFSVIVYEILSAENVDSVRELDDNNLRILDLIRCAYFDSDIQFENIMSQASEKIREALLEARRDAAAAGGLKTMFATPNEYPETES